MPSDAVYLHRRTTADISNFILNTQQMHEATYWCRFASLKLDRAKADNQVRELKCDLLRPSDKPYAHAKS